MDKVSSFFTIGRVQATVRLFSTKEIDEIHRAHRMDGCFIRSKWVSYLLQIKRLGLCDTYRFCFFGCLPDHDSNPNVKWRVPASKLQPACFSQLEPWLVSKSSLPLVATRNTEITKVGNKHTQVSNVRWRVPSVKLHRCNRGRYRGCLCHRSLPETLGLQKLTQTHTQACTCCHTMTRLFRSIAVASSPAHSLLRSETSYISGWQKLARCAHKWPFASTHRWYSQL